MTKSWKTSQILMIFLLLWFVIPQGTQAQYMPVSNTYSFNSGTNGQVDLTTPGQPEHNNHNPENYQYDIVDGKALADNFQNFEWINIPGGKTPQQFTRSYMSGKRNQFGIQNHENYVQLYMKGESNQATATQQNGQGNLMNVQIYGSSNQGDYLQHGSNNYIDDQIGSEGNPVSGVHHEINQYGNGLGINNQGIQTIPLIINQWGSHMKLKISGSP